MGCGFSSSASSSRAVTRERSARRLLDAAAAETETPPALPDLPNHTIPPGCVGESDNRTDTRAATTTTTTTTTTTLSIAAVGALDCRPSKQAQNGKHRVRQWVQEVHLLDVDADPFADSASAAKLQPSSASLSSCADLSQVRRPEHVDSGRRLSHAAVRTHELHMARSGGDDEPTW